MIVPAYGFGLKGASVPPPGRDEALEFLLEQTRKGNASVVTILRTDDLHANRQTCRGKANRRNGSRQIGHRGKSRPEPLICGRHAFPVDDDCTEAINLAALIVGQSR